MATEIKTRATTSVGIPEKVSGSHRSSGLMPEMCSSVRKLVDKYVDHVQLILWNMLIIWAKIRLTSSLHLVYQHLIPVNINMPRAGETAFDACIFSRT